jgi:hypothetical protein
MIILGIDPGAKGAIGVMVNSPVENFFMGTKTYTVVKMPETEMDLSVFLAQYSDLDESVYCYLEKVHAMPMDGRSSLAKFMTQYGTIRGILVALQIPIIDVSPGRWTKALGVTAPKGSSKSEIKRIHKAKAQALYPKLKFTLDTADAMLIAHYGLLQEKGS